MDGAPADQLSTERNLILGLLLALAGAAWVALVWQGRYAGMNTTMDSATMGPDAPTLFPATWVLMMVAMMFPTAAPMILTFHKVRAGMGQRGGALVSTGVFVVGYLLVWTLAGIVAYAGGLAVEAIAAHATPLPATGARIGGGVLVSAGFYQLTPLKERCLSKCRTPIAFIVKSWRDGASGAALMGVHHGAYCLGCCWLLFVILFPLGMMNVAVMAIITVVILAEKTLPWPRAASGAMAAALVIYGAIVIAVPEILPTFSTGGNKAMPVHIPMSASPMPHDTR